MKKNHNYRVTLNWTGNTGEGTKEYTSYDRSHTLHIPQKVPILCSSDPAFRGDAGKHNPEELLVSSLSSCHMLWYLHLCANNGIVVTAYEDEATGTLTLNEDGSGQFTEVVLKPRVTVTNGDHIARALLLHDEAHSFCFIARSCNFPVTHQASCRPIV